MKNFPFTEAEMMDEFLPTVTYLTGRNNTGTHQNEVIRRRKDLTGQAHEEVIMRGLSETKTAAIVLILNAPENPS
jgi:hypothetical protein